MENRKNRVSTTVSVAIILLLATAPFLASTSPQVNAVTNVTTYAYLSLNPNPISMGEYTVVNMWLEPIPPTASDVFHGFMVTITKPDGSTETKGPFTSSAIGSQYFVYTPDSLGQYTFKMTYPGENFAGDTFVYAASETPETTLTVQEQAVPSWSETPLPDGYWERPINAANRLWDSISGNWLIRGYNTTYVQGASDSGKGFNPYSQAPLTPHVMWTKELALGGLIGGDYGDASFYTGLTYETKLSPPIIMDGKMYYRMYPSDFGYYQGVAGAWPGVICVDLRTGEELWRNEDMYLDAAQIFNFVSGNQMGGIPYLWDMASIGPFAMFAIGLSVMARPNTWHLYDANTGDLIANFTNAATSAFFSPAMTVYRSNGEMNVYVLSGRAGWLAMWNSTKMFEAAGFIPDISGSEVPFLRNKPGTYDWLDGIEWNATVPVITAMDATGALFPSASGITGNVLIAAVESRATSYKEVGYSLTDGHQLWVHDLDIDHYTAARAFGQGIYADFNPNRRLWVGYDAETGAQLWTSDQTDYPWGTYGLSGIITYDKLYVLSYDGSVHAFSITDGKQVFKYYSGDDMYRETPYGTFPFYYGPIIADNVVYAGNGEHSPSIPLYRGYQLHAFSASDGTPIWTFPGWHVIQAIADGYLVSYNAEDNMIYVFGKGPSATTVSVSSQVVAKDSGVLISGTVTDQSAGQAGTPAIADKDMSAWMSYLKRQQEIPANADGVSVTLVATRSDGTVETIGAVTSDMSGVFKKLWTPTAEGEYTITATFAGSESYGSSYAETCLGVVSASSSSQSTTSNSAYAFPMEGVYVGAVVIIVLALALVIVVFRRKK